MGAGKVTPKRVFPQKQMVQRKIVAPQRVEPRGFDCIITGQNLGKRSLGLGYGRKSRYERKRGEQGGTRFPKKEGYDTNVAQHRTDS